MKLNLFALFFLATIFVLKAQESPTVFGHDLEHRMVRISTNFLVDDNLNPILDVITRAKENCYNEVLLSDVKFGYLSEYIESPNYFNNLHTFLDSAKALGLAVYPETVYFGYSGPTLFRDPNLAEGIPVKDAKFIVGEENGELVVLNAGNDIQFNNGDFELEPTNGENFPGWSWQDEEGLVTFWDESVSHSGNASARVTNPNLNSNGNARIVQSVSVETFKDYHFSVWVRTEDFDDAFVNILVYDVDKSRSHQYNALEVESTQDWKKYDITFNTLDSEDLSIYLGIWGGGNGSLWWDDITLEPTRFNNLIRRAGAPVQVKLISGLPIKEGEEIDSIIDPLSGTSPWSGYFDVWHEQPLIKIPDGSDLSLGDSLLISYYHTAIINNGQVCASLTEQDVFFISESQLSEIKDEFEKAEWFDGWFLGYDEIRVHGWDLSPDYGGPGQDLAFNINAIQDIALSLAPATKRLMTWSDMFDPFHNAYDAGDPYYLVDGLWNGSWEGLVNSTEIMNWNSGSERTESAEFFASRGHTQILAGYYDNMNFYTLDWLSDLEEIDGINGVMFTTWTQNYADLEDWATYVWGACETNSTSELNNIGGLITIGPNPSFGKLFIQTDLEITDVKCFDLNGQKQPISNPQPSTIDVSELPGGMYVLRIKTQAGILNKKFAVNNNNSV